MFPEVFHFKASAWVPQKNTLHWDNSGSATGGTTAGGAATVAAVGYPADPVIISRPI